MFESLALIFVSVQATIVGMIMGFVGALYILYKYEKDMGESLFKDYPDIEEK